MSEMKNAGHARTFAPRRRFTQDDSHAAIGSVSPQTDAVLFARETPLWFAASVGPRVLGVRPCRCRFLPFLVCVVVTCFAMKNSLSIGMQSERHTSAI